MSRISDSTFTGPLGQALKADSPVLLIDEVDKADIEFPNDLLHELDTMEFSIPRPAKPFRIKATQCHHHIECIKRVARCVFAAVRVSLHRLPGGRGLEQIIRVHYRTSKPIVTGCAGSILRCDLPEVRKERARANS